MSKIKLTIKDVYYELDPFTNENAKGTYSHKDESGNFNMFLDQDKNWKLNAAKHPDYVYEAEMELGDALETHFA